MTTENNEDGAYFGRNSCPTMASSTELFPELWLPITTILGSLSASLWSMLSSILRISINFLVRCMSPFCCESISWLLELSDLAFGSDGDDMVAATRAAIVAFSVGGRFFELPGSFPLLSLSS